MRPSGVGLALVLLQGDRVPARLPSHQSTTSQALFESAGESPAPAATRAAAGPPGVERHCFGAHGIGIGLEELDDSRLGRALRTLAPGSEAHAAPRTGHRPLRRNNLEQRHRERKRHSELGWIQRIAVEVRQLPGPGALRARAATRGRIPRTWPAATPWKGCIHTPFIVDVPIEVTSRDRSRPRLRRASRPSRACRDRRRALVRPWQPAARAPRFRALERSVGQHSGNLRDPQRLREAHYVEVRHRRARMIASGYCHRPIDGRLLGLFDPLNNTSGDLLDHRLRRGV